MVNGNRVNAAQPDTSLTNLKAEAKPITTSLERNPPQAPWVEVHPEGYEPGEPEVFAAPPARRDPLELVEIDRGRGEAKQLPAEDAASPMSFHGPLVARLTPDQRAKAIADGKADFLARKQRWENQLKALRKLGIMPPAEQPLAPELVPFARLRDEACNSVRHLSEMIEADTYAPIAKHLGPQPDGSPRRWLLNRLGEAVSHCDEATIALAGAEQAYATTRVQPAPNPAPLPVVAELPAPADTAH